MASDYHLIARNTIFLYIRLLVVAFMGLITSRVILQAFGVRGFGLYTVVGGLVIFLSFLQNTMSSTTQRFLNYEMGGGNEHSQKAIFAACFSIHKYISYLVIFLAETIGLWFLNTVMNIHDDEIITANIIYQLSVFTFIAGILSTPYRAVLTSHEKMDYLAYLYIAEAIIKCIIAILVSYASFGPIIIYSAFLLLLNVVLFFLYKRISLSLFKESNTTGFKASKQDVIKVSSFASWIVLGSIGTLSHTHGIGLAVNLFFGLTANAALGIANQILGLIRQFILSFMSALNPQIVKNYASNDIRATRSIVKYGCKMGFFLVAIIAVPIFVEAPFLLKVWLGNVPMYTVPFVRINTIIITLWAISPPLTTAQLATGEIKKFQSVLTAISLLHLPLTILFFKMGYKPQTALLLYLMLTLLMQSYRIYYVCNSLMMGLWSFIYEIVLKSIIVIVSASSIPIAIHCLLTPSLMSSFYVIVTSVICLLISFYYLSLNTFERSFVFSLFNHKFIKSA